MGEIVYTEEERIEQLELKLHYMKAVVDAARMLPMAVAKEAPDEYAWLMSALVTLDKVIPNE